MLALLEQLAVSFDLPILDWIQANLTSPLADEIWPRITLLGDDGIFWIALAVILLFFRKTRRTGLGMGIAMALGLLVCNIILKPAVARPRPYDFQAELGVIIPLLTERMHDFSFPSGHTIASFEASVVILLNHKKAGIAALVLACLIAFSRLYLYVHYPTDVIVSVFLGTGVAFLGNFLAGRIMNRLPQRKGKFEL